jgi:hypothetical protein
MHSLGFVVFLHCCYGIWIITRCNVPFPLLLPPPPLLLLLLLLCSAG